MHWISFCLADSTVCSFLPYNFLPSYLTRRTSTALGPRVNGFLEQPFGSTPQVSSLGDPAYNFIPNVSFTVRKSRASNLDRFAACEMMRASMFRPSGTCVWSDTTTKIHGTPPQILRHQLKHQGKITEYTRPWSRRAHSICNTVTKCNLARKENTRAALGRTFPSKRYTTGPTESSCGLLHLLRSHWKNHLGFRCSQASPNWVLPRQLSEG